MWQYNYSGELYHHGIKGQRWGVRRTQKQLGHDRTKSKFDHANELDKVVMTTKSGETLSLTRNPTPAFTRFLGRHSKKVQETLRNSDIMRITNKKGENVGELQLYKESPDSINVVWVGVDKKHEGKGYGSATMKAVTEYARQTNCKSVTLEVPGTSPNARHIYEKLGFKAEETPFTDTDDVWGGLTRMRLDLKE